MSETVIKVEHLAKEYRLGQRGASYKTFRDALAQLTHKSVDIKKDEYFWAINDISFEIAKGEVVGIIGRNGAGKSTLLKMLSRITEPTRGRIEMKGRVGSLLEVGTGFHPELTGRENVYLNGAILGMGRKEINQKFDDIVTFAELDKFMETPVKHYSSGMYVRLAFAVAAYLEPEILMIDEVLAVGDIEFQKKCIGRMENVANNGKTVLLVSHNMSTVKSICSRAMMLDQGKIVKSGDVQEVINEYLGGFCVDGIEKAFDEKDHSSIAGDHMRVTKIKLDNGVQSSFRVHWQQPLEVTVELEVMKEAKNVRFGACLRMLDGTYLVVSYNDDSQDVWNLTPGVHQIKFQLHNQLKPGMYTLSIGAHDKFAEFRNYFHLDAATIEILDYNEAGTVASPNNPALFTGVPSSFEMKQLNAQS